MTKTDMRLIILAPFIFWLIFWYILYLASTERERDIEHKAKVCEIERQNNMKLDDFCIWETDF